MLIAELSINIEKAIMLIAELPINIEKAIMPIAELSINIELYNSHNFEALQTIEPPS
jgi:hypothetical protein